MADSSTGIASLPNEILMNILSLFPTRDLLPFTPTSRLFHNLILRLLHQRLSAAASLSHHQMILECYHPAAKISTPYYTCDYLSTDTLHPTPNEEHALSLHHLRNLYSHYRPRQPEGERRVWRRKRGGGWRAATISEDLPQDAPPDTEEVLEEYVSQDIDLESHELFSQLQSQVNLVKVGPRRGLFLSIVEIGEGLTRIWRDWLAERARRLKAGEEGEVGEQRERLLWSEKGEHIGLRVRVLERDDVAPPVLVERHEDAHVGYTLQYEELVVRTSHLLLKYEQSLDQEALTNGKALVIVA